MEYGITVKHKYKKAFYYFTYSHIPFKRLEIRQFLFPLAQDHHVMCPTFWPQPRWWQDLWPYPPSDWSVSCSGRRCWLDGWTPVEWGESERCSPEEKRWQRQPFWERSLNLTRVQSRPTASYTVFVLWDVRFNKDISIFTFWQVQHSTSTNLIHPVGSLAIATEPGDEVSHLVTICLYDPLT